MGNHPLKTVLSVQELAKEFRHPLTLRRMGGIRNVSFEVFRGEAFGLLGPNGAGKTTTLKLLLGLLRPSGGSGTLLDAPLGSQEARRRLGYLPEHPYFYDYLSAHEFLELCADLSGLDRARVQERIHEVLEELDLAGVAHVPMRKYSKGMVQRVGLAQAVLADPEFLILDEPMSGLDPVGRALARELILRLKGEGRTILMSSHILHDVELICDRVGILRGGELLDCFDLTALTGGEGSSVRVRVMYLPSGVLSHLPGSPKVRELGREVLLEVSQGADLNPLLSALLGHGAQVLEVSRNQPSLEEVFLRVIQGGGQDRGEERVG